jgi:hypothetical protein
VIAQTPMPGIPRLDVPNAIRHLPTVNRQPSTAKPPNRQTANRQTAKPPNRQTAQSEKRKAKSQKPNVAERTSDVAWSKGSHAAHPVCTVLCRGMSGPGAKGCGEWFGSEVQRTNGDPSITVRQGFHLAGCAGSTQAPR